MNVTGKGMQLSIYIHRQGEDGGMKIQEMNHNKIWHKER